MSLIDLLKTSSPNEPLYSNDVFSTYLYTGNGSTQTITNGIDLAGKGGMVWIKNRSLGTTAEGNRLVDSLNSGRTFGWTNISESTNGRFDGTVNPFLSNGFTLDSTYGTQGYLTTGSNYASWTFRKAAKFFDVQTITHTNGTANNIDLSALGTVGMVIAKITTTTGDWTVWQRGLTAGNNLQLNLTNAQSTTNAWLSVSGTTATLAAAAPTGTYVIYAYAHDTSSTGIIQCGSFTTDAGGNATVSLGWEPQFYIVKRAVGGAEGWEIEDTMRNLNANYNAPNSLFANTLAAEAQYTSQNITATGFKYNYSSSATYIYMAIRRPNKPPTSGTQVYNAIARTGTGAVATVTGVGFSPDLVMSANRSSAGYGNLIQSRLNGTSIVKHPFDNSDTTSTVAVTSFNMDGYSLGTDSGASGTGEINKSGDTFINWLLKRYVGVFDQICWVGTNITTKRLAHNLGVIPELALMKASNPQWWFVYHKDLGISKYLYLNQPNAVATFNVFGTLAPTATDIGFNEQAQDTNTTTLGTNTGTMYLFATLAGISKVGSYTGNGGTQNIECGFAAGARFVLIKRTDSTGDWYVWDTARGIVAANDPHLSLNTTAAEVTTDDSVDPYAAGFAVNQVAATNINVSSATYIFLAIA